MTCANCHETNTLTTPVLVSHHRQEHWCAECVLTRAVTCSECSEVVSDNFVYAISQASRIVNVCLDDLVPWSVGTKLRAEFAELSRGL